MEEDEAEHMDNFGAAAAAAQIEVDNPTLVSGFSPRSTLPNRSSFLPSLTHSPP